jgi:hypothetical protein
MHELFNICFVPLSLMMTTYIDLIFFSARINGSNELSNEANTPSSGFDRESFYMRVQNDIALMILVDILHDDSDAYHAI